MERNGYFLKNGKDNLPLELVQCKRTDSIVLANMAIHYSQPRGFVGRNICYRIEYDGICYGSIAGGSSTLHLPGRDEFFGITKENKKQKLLKIVDLSLEFYRKFLPSCYVKETELGYDIEIKGHELGSYGIRECEFLKWIYGTGCAEPRLSSLIKIYGVS